MSATLTDPRGVPVCAPEPAALEDFERALEALYTFRDDPLALINPVIEQWPEFALAHVFKALVLVNLTERRFTLAARRALGRATPLLGKGGERERKAHEVVTALVDGETGHAATGLDEMLLDHPRDILALHAGHNADFARGDVLNLRNRIMRVLPAWQPDHPGYANVLAMLAFGLEEANQYAEAEAAGYRALEADAANPWAVHAVAHVMEMTGRVDDGIEHLTSRRADWAPNSGFAYHNWWHLALFHLDRDEPDRVLELYDEQIDDPEAAFALNKLDASALLWRLRLLGVDIGQRFVPLADWWREGLEREAGYYAFNDLHAAVAFAAVADHQALETLATLQAERSAATPDERAAVTGSVGMPLVAAVSDYAHGRFGRAAQTLRSLRDSCRIFGGSHAQRDLVTLTLIDAAHQAGEHALVEAYVNERLVAKPASPLGWRLKARYAG